MQVLLPIVRLIDDNGGTPHLQCESSVVVIL